MIAAELERAQGHFAEAERLARSALASLQELRAESNEIMIVRALLAESLLGLGRPGDARVQIEAAIALHAQTNFREDYAAEHEVTLAKIEMAEGKRAAAIERAQRALAVFDHHPRHRQSRADAERLVAR